MTFPKGVQYGRRMLIRRDGKDIDEGRKETDLLPGRLNLR